MDQPQGPPVEPPVPPPPAAKPAQPETTDASLAGLYIPVLTRALKKLSDEYTICWVLVGLTALMTGVQLFWFFTTFVGMIFSVFSPSYPDPWSNEFGVSGLLSIIPTLLLSALGPGAVVIVAILNYRQRYSQVSFDLRHGLLALALVDESYAQQIELLRQGSYKPLQGTISLGRDFDSRLNHFAYFYPQYQILARGPAEPAVPTVAPVNCWFDGVVMWFCGGSCVFIAIPLILRIIFTYPRFTATKRAVLDYFSGG